MSISKIAEAGIGEDEQEVGLEKYFEKGQFPFVTDIGDDFQFYYNYYLS